MSAILDAIIAHAEMICAETLATRLEVETEDGTLVYDPETRTWTLLDKSGGEDVA